MKFQKGKVTKMLKKKNYGKEIKNAIAQIINLIVYTCKIAAHVTPFTPFILREDGSYVFPCVWNKNPPSTVF